VLAYGPPEAAARRGLATASLRDIIELSTAASGSLLTNEGATTMASAKTKTGTAEQATAKESAQPKGKKTWAQRLAEMDPEEAAALRAKANEASKRSRARKKGTTPERAAVARIEAAMAKNEQRRLALLSDYAVLEEELKDARAALEAAEAKEAGNATG
jgi:hypothetical protein